MSDGTFALFFVLITFTIVFCVIFWYGFLNAEPDRPTIFRIAPDLGLGMSPKYHIEAMNRFGRWVTMKEYGEWGDHVILFDTVEAADKYINDTRVRNERADAHMKEPPRTRAF